MTEPITVTRHTLDSGTVCVLTMDAGENRWNTTFTRAFDAALDEVEATSGPTTLVTTSSNSKFFSNGLDLAWITGAPEVEAEGGERRVFAAEAMALFARLITLPLPTVCAIGGHAFGAGLMIAMAHDVRVMRADRGFLCANELELGFAIPAPEMALFAHKMSADAFHQTIVLAKRWTGPEALAAGVVQEIVPEELVADAAIARATDLLRVARSREITGWTKEHLYGEHAAAIYGPDGPAHLLRHPERYPSGPGTVPSGH